MLLLHGIAAVACSCLQLHHSSSRSSSRCLVDLVKYRTRREALPYCTTAQVNSLRRVLQDPGGLPGAPPLGPLQRTPPGLAPWGSHCHAYLARVSLVDILSRASHIHSALRPMAHWSDVTLLPTARRVRTHKALRMKPRLTRSNAHD